MTNTFSRGELIKLAHKAFQATSLDEIEFFTFKLALLNEIQAELLSRQLTPNLGLPADLEKLAFSTLPSKESTVL
jgi:hypothetical protein